jgi:hypothetical protein
MPRRVPAEIREYYLPDFSRWKDHDSHTKASID